MKTSKRKLHICLVAILAVAIASPGLVCSQSAALKSPGSSGSEKEWSIEVKRVEPGETELAYSFQAATYEGLLEELNKTHRFNHIFRDGDRKAADAPNLLVLRTTVVKYTAGSETRRAVTTVSGATKLNVHSQLVTRDGRVVLDRTVNGSVRFFGSNLRATHNLAHNIAKVIKESRLITEQPGAAVTSGVNTDSAPGGHS